MSLLGLCDHGAADVYPNHPTTRSHHPRQVPHVIPRPTPDIEQAHAIVQLKLREHYSLDAFDVLQDIPRIEKADEKPWIRLPINRGKPGDVLSVFHGHGPSRSRNLASPSCRETGATLRLLSSSTAKRAKLDDSMTMCGRNGNDVPMGGEVSSEPCHRSPISSATQGLLAIPGESRRHLCSWRRAP